MGFFPCEIRLAFPGESQLPRSRATQPTVHAGCFSVSIIQRDLTWTTGSLTYAQMLMHAIAQACRPLVVHKGKQTRKAKGSVNVFVLGSELLVQPRSAN